MNGHRFTWMLASVTVALMVIAPGASAQDFDDMEDEEESTLEIRAGTSIPGGDLDGYFDPGFSAGLGFTFPISDRTSFALSGDVGFLSDIQEDEEIGTGEVEQFFEGDLRMYHYGGDLLFDLVDPAESDMSLILHGGIGATTIDPDQTIVVEGGAANPTLNDAETRTRFTANAGLSLGFELSEDVDLLLDGKAYSIFLDDEDFEVEDTVEDEIGETWWTFPVQAMIKFRTP